MNQFQLTASIAERDIMRFTPAGLPIVTAKLLHNSQQIEAGIARQIEFDIPALAAGEIAGTFNQAALGEVFQFTGFLARKSRNSRTLIFHILHIESKA